MSDTPLETASSYESESLIPTGRIHGTAEFWFNAGKAQTSMNRVIESLADVERVIPNLGENVAELKKEMLRFDSIMQHLAEYTESSELSDFSSL